MDKRPRFIELDGLRGIAATWVVVFHLTHGPHYLFDGKLPPDLLDQIWPWRFDIEGHFAVDLFLIISGFVIIMTVERCSSVGDFALSRFARLYPAFWTATTITCACIILCPLPGEQATFAQYVANMTMFHQYLSIPALNNVYWSLELELGFYLLIAGVFAIGLLSRINLIGIAWVSISFIVEKLIPGLGAAMPSRASLLLGLEYAPLFFAGILFYQIWSDGITRPRLFLLALCYLDWVIFEQPISVILTTANFGLVGLSIIGGGAFLRFAPIVFLGTISYSLYIIHAPIAARVQILLGELGVPPLVNLALSIALAIGCAAVLTFAVERPANRVIRSIRSRAISPVAAA
jgi:peptidoglycan/LPS O-acetylase OafA/YrhL